MINKLLLAICVVFALTNTALSIFLLSRSFIAQEERQTTKQIVENLECILLIQPNERNVDNVQACRFGNRNNTK